MSWNENEQTHNSCYCHIGNAPCGYCTDGFKCDMCEERKHNDEYGESEGMAICYDCADELGITDEYE